MRGMRLFWFFVGVFLGAVAMGYLLAPHVLRR
jgi:hypothetical protein